MREPDRTYADPTALLHDVLDNDRSDLDAYVGVADVRAASHRRDKKHVFLTQRRAISRVSHAT